MRYLAWIAVFSLQMGMFVCAAGIDVCHAADTPAQLEATLSYPDHDNSTENNSVDQTCSAHAAHVFLGPADHAQSQPEAYVEPAIRLISLNLPEILHLIEQPPRFLHS